MNKKSPNTMVLDPTELSQIKAHLTKTPKPNLLNSLLRLLTHNSLQNPSKALHLYSQILPISDRFTFTYSLKACCSLLPSLKPKGLEIHAHVIKTGHHSDLFIQNSLISFYSSLSDPHSARKAFDEITGPNVVSWTSVVSALSRNGRELEALLMFGSMSVRPNALTLVTALSACSKLGSVNVGKSIHGYSLKSVGIGNNIILDNATLEMYVGCGDLNSVCRIFDVMPERDVVSWTSVISGYVRNGRCEEAIEVFVLMVRDGEVVPNEATLVSVLGACVSTGGLRLGKWVHSYIFRRCAGVDTVAGNALIDMYAKCGEIHMALKVFDALECKDLVSWCTIIGGIAVNGRVQLVFQLFALMICHGFRPNGVAFLAVLSACCHAGLVEEGMMFFKSMNKVYGIEPQKEHYSCLIDTFGRTGRLEDADQLICRLPVEPDEHVWGAFLNACKIYGGGNEAVLDRLAKRILGGEVAVGGGTYALLSNMLAKDGKWEESNRVREHMRLKKIRKNAGYSCIEVCRS